MLEGLERYKMKSTNSCQKDRQNGHPAPSMALYETFYHTYDASRISGLFSRFLSLEDPRHDTQWIGEGRCSLVYKIPTGKGMDLALSIVKADFFERKPQPTREHWLNTMTTLHRHAANRQLPLIPPFELLNLRGQVGLVLPFGKVLRSDSPAMEAAANDLNQLLAGLGLRLNDHLQLAMWQGEIFIHDFSDLTSRR